MTASQSDVRSVVVDALVSMVSGVTGMVPPTDTPLPGFIQGPVDRAVSKIEAARAADKARIAALEDAAREALVVIERLRIERAGRGTIVRLKAALAQQGKEQTL